MSFAIPDKLTANEKEWQKLLSTKPMTPSAVGSNLEWSGKLTSTRLGVLNGQTKYNRDAPAEEVAKLKILQGHLKTDWYLTKLRKNFAKAEMEKDILLVDSQVGGKTDDVEYVSILPTSPP